MNKVISWARSVPWFQEGSIRSDEGLTLETSAFQIFNGAGNSTLIVFDTTKILMLDKRIDYWENASGTFAWKETDILYE